MLESALVYNVCFNEVDWRVTIRINLNYLFNGYFELSRYPFKPSLVLWVLVKVDLFILLTLEQVVLESTGAPIRNIAIDTLIVGGVTKSLALVVVKPILYFVIDLFLAFPLHLLLDLPQVKELVLCLVGPIVGYNWWKLRFSHVKDVFVFGLLHNIRIIRDTSLLWLVCNAASPHLKVALWISLVVNFIQFSLFEAVCSIWLNWWHLCNRIRWLVVFWQHRYQLFIPVRLLQSVHH